MSNRGGVIQGETTGKELVNLGKVCVVKRIWGFNLLYCITS